MDSADAEYAVLRALFFGFAPRAFLFLPASLPFAPVLFRSLRHRDWWRVRSPKLQCFRRIDCVRPERIKPGPMRGDVRDGTSIAADARFAHVMVGAFEEADVGHAAAPAELGIGV